MMRAFNHVLLSRSRAPRDGFEETDIVVDSDQWDYFDATASYAQMRDYNGDVPLEGYYVKTWTGARSVIRLYQNSSTYAPGTYQGGITKGWLGNYLNGDRVDGGSDTRNLSDGVLFGIGFRFFPQADSASAKIVYGSTFGIDMRVDINSGEYECTGNVAYADGYTVDPAVFQSLITTDGELNSAILHRAPGSRAGYLYLNGQMVGGGPVRIADQLTGSVSIPGISASGNGYGVIQSSSNHASKGHISRAVIVFGESDASKIGNLHSWLCGG